MGPGPSRGHFSLQLARATCFAAVRAQRTLSGGRKPAKAAAAYTLDGKVVGGLVVATASSLPRSGVTLQLKGSRAKPVEPCLLMAFCQKLRTRWLPWRLCTLSSLTRLLRQCMSCRQALKWFLMLCGRPCEASQAFEFNTSEGGLLARDGLSAQLAGVVNHLASGRAHSAAAPLLAGASLVAIPKPHGGVRPIAIGEVLRRLTGKCLIQLVRDDARSVFFPAQVGVAVLAGSEAAVHCARAWHRSLGVRH